MGLRYRQSIRVGKFFRINISTRGIGYSVGVPGMRYTRAANGSTYTTYSIPGTGISYRQSHNKPQNTQPANSGVISETTIESASIDNFRDTEATDLLKALDKAVNFDKSSTALILCGIFFCFLYSISIWFLIAGCAGLAYGIFLKCFAHLKLRVALHYELDEFTEQSHNDRISKWETFFSSKVVWQVNSIGLNKSTKVNGGAAFSEIRSKITSIKKLPFYINTNQPFVYFKLKSEYIIILPDRMFIHKNGKFGTINYDDISISATELSFVEDGIVPKDAFRIGNTWKFVNKNGTPDRRFNNNYLIPVCLYGYLTLKSDNGLNIQLSCSNHENIKGFK